MLARKTCARCSKKLKWGDPGRFHWSGVGDCCWNEDDARKDADLADKPRKKTNKKAEMRQRLASLTPAARESLLRLQREANKDR